MIKPNELKVCVHAVNGEDLCDYVASHFKIQDYKVFEIIRNHHFGDSCLGDLDLDGHLFELIIEEEDYCNDDGLHYEVLEFIVDEFGGHFNINFLGLTAYM